jgi:type II secretory pathway pseudopilin PulG
MINQKTQLKLYKSSEAGYTILEGIMAIVVVSVMMIAIGPVIALSVGTRLQAKRMEMATQAARSYIDYVKSIDTNLETYPGDYPDYYPSITTTKTDVVGAPTGTTGLYCADFDDTAGCQTDSPSDMYVQGIGYHPTSTDIHPSNGFILGVRVYRANSFAAGVGTLQTKPPANTSVTNAVGDRTKPMLVMTTQVIPDGLDYKALENLLN